jgi:hypothetical protein
MVRFKKAQYRFAPAKHALLRSAFPQIMERAVLQASQIGSGQQVTITEDRFPPFGDLKQEFAILVRQIHV